LPRIRAHEIIESLGADGQGEVYRARDLKLARSVAVKVLNGDAAMGPDALCRFEMEARAASALNHPAIVTIHDFGERDGRVFIVMELVEGVTLRQMLQRGPPVLKRALQIAGQLAGALAPAHEAGIVHGHLTPETVLVMGDGRVKIVDFGAARLTSSEAPSANPDARPAYVWAPGDVGYIAPEQALGEAGDFRADQFAFGALLYELTTGVRAFDRPTVADTLSMVVNETPEPPQRIRPSIPAPLAWIIERCLAKDPADRYASTRDLARDIELVLNRLEDRRARDLRAGRSVRRRAAAAVAAIALAFGGVAYLATQRTGLSASFHAPTFTQLTFGRGHIVAARFAPEGGAVLYASAWNGGPVSVFETRLTGPESRRWEPAGASLASMSRSGVFALLLDCRIDWSGCTGTLAEMPRGGGAPRELLEDVASADWAPDGTQLAAIQALDGKFQLQFPLDHTLYTSAARLGSLRVSRRGDRMAFVERDTNAGGKSTLKMIDLEGGVTTLSSGWEEIREIAWSPDDEEIWLSGNERGQEASLYAISRAGHRRLVLQRPGGVQLRDVTTDGRVLVTSGVSRARMVWSDDEMQRELSWLDWSTAADVSADGRTILFAEGGDAVGAQPVVYLRTSDGADAIRLGDGKALALSPDGQWALALQEQEQGQQLALLPTGAGEARVLPREGMTDVYWARWFPDGRRLLLAGADVKGAPASYILHLDSDRLERVGEPGVLARLLSPDGQRLLVHDSTQGYRVWPLDGGQPVALPLHGDYQPVQWSADGQFLYVTTAEPSAVRLHRFHIASERAELVKELKPRDASGLLEIADGPGELAVTPDGRTCVFTYRTRLEDLFLVQEPSS
jgi:Tol biopolymer transport system component